MKAKRTWILAMLLCLVETALEDMNEEIDTVTDGPYDKCFIFTSAGVNV